MKHDSFIEKVNKIALNAGHGNRIRYNKTIEKWIFVDVTTKNIQK